MKGVSKVSRARVAETHFNFLYSVSVAVLSSLKGEGGFPRVHIMGNELRVPLAGNHGA